MSGEEAEGESHRILAYKYSTCQDKVEENWEVTGVAGVRGEDGNQKLETKRRRRRSTGPE